MTYADLLKDPRWQRRRLEVLERAGWACEQCSATTRTLHVHHVRYVRGRMPWAYGDDELQCLCEHCHARQHPEKGGLTPLSAIVPRVVERLVPICRYRPDLCVVCHASYRVDLTRCASCRADAPLPHQTESVA
jgi:hypothetical protein